MKRCSALSVPAGRAASGRVWAAAFGLLTLLLVPAAAQTVPPAAQPSAPAWLSPKAPGVASTAVPCPQTSAWEAQRCCQWQAFAQGDYIYQPRTAHVPEYRLRVDDRIALVYTLTHERISSPYQLNVGDQILVESFTDAELNRTHVIQPDGTITLRLLGQVPAAGKTVAELRELLEEQYKKYYKTPAITVQPIQVNSKLNALRDTVDRRFGEGGQSQNVRVNPQGTIAVPMLGEVCAQGLTLTELKAELEARYRDEEDIEGMEVVPVLAERAPRYVYVLGEVRQPGRYELVAPTSLIEAISLAGGWNHGGNLRQVIVLRRCADWRLLATKVNIQAPLYGCETSTEGNIWLADSDVVIVPKGAVQVAADFIDLVFTRGIYGVFPFSASYDLRGGSTL